MVIPIQIGVVALLGGAYFVYLNVRGDTVPKPTPSATSSSVGQARFVSAKGGFELRVPKGMKATKNGKTVTLKSDDKDLVVTVGPVLAGSLSTSSKSFVAAIKGSYTDVKVLGTRQETVDGRKALATFGQAVNVKKFRIRFVNLVVAVSPRNFAINSFTGFNTDPALILPRVNAIVNSFRIAK